MKLKIAGDFWEIRLLSPEVFIKEHGPHFKEAAAVTNVLTRTVDYRTDELTEVNVRHETFHMYFSTQLIFDADLSPDQVEETAACLMGKYGEEYIKNSRKIWKWLKKQKT